MDTTLIQIFAKAPIEGFVKTRLAEKMGKAAALLVHQRLCNAMIHRVQASTTAVRQAEIWVATPTGMLPSMGECETGILPLRKQPEGDLGARMGLSIQQGLKQYHRVIIVGADAYSVDAHYLAQADHWLKSVDLVIGPAWDGGYVLIGMRRFIPELFVGIPWGTPRVLSETLLALRQLAVSFVLLPCRWDIDTLEDIRQYAPELLSGLASTAFNEDR